MKYGIWHLDVYSLSPYYFVHILKYVENFNHES